MNIFLDLDGTLIDSRKRLYKLFCFLVSDSNMSFDEYWDKKRNGISHRNILTCEFGFSDVEIEEFEKKWMHLIEQPEWIAFDQPFEGIKEKLLQLKERHVLILVTARQHMQVVYAQIKCFDWEGIFTDILITEQKIEKVQLIQQHFLISNDDWFIGDTGKDIQTGKLLNINTAGVLSGFLNRSKIEKYCPSIIIDNLLSFNY